MYIKNVPREVCEYCDCLALHYKKGGVTWCGRIMFSDNGKQCTYSDQEIREVIILCEEKKKKKSNGSRKGTPLYAQTG